MSDGWLRPDWPAPRGVRAACSTRALPGASAGPYASFNLATHVGDDTLAVAENRARLRAALALPREPRWLAQVHGVGVASGADDCVTADASIARSAREPACVVLTADCLPLLLCTEDASAVAAVHAGWRGLAAGVIEATVAALAVAPACVLAWLGPAIGPRAYEVGEDVRSALLAADRDAAAAFEQTRPGHWSCDLYALARRRLEALGIGSVHGGGLCTHADARRFYSYRRDGVTGRFASLVWLLP